MDFAITKKKIPNCRRYFILLALPLLFAVNFPCFLGQTEFNIDKESVSWPMLHVHII